MLLMESKREIFGKRLKYLRNKTNRSQEYIAKLIGISRARYSHYENNHVEPDMELIRKLADYFEVTSDYLLGMSDYPYTDENNQEDNEKTAIMNKIANDFPDADLMFHDLSNMSAEDLQDVYDFIKFKKSQKGSD